VERAAIIVALKAQLHKVAHSLQTYVASISSSCDGLVIKLMHIYPSCKPCRHSCTQLRTACRQQHRLHSCMTSLILLLGWRSIVVALTQGTSAHCCAQPQAHSCTMLCKTAEGGTVAGGGGGSDAAAAAVRKVTTNSLMSCKQQISAMICYSLLILLSCCYPASEGLQETLV
jgi:hypothetical protein